MSLTTALRLVLSATAALGVVMSAAATEVPAKPAKPVKKTVTKAALPAGTFLEDLTPEQLANAERVFVGNSACEFNQSVAITEDTAKKGYFLLAFKGKTYTMAPEPTSTGAIRLEDKKNGIVWLQIPSKSMLMNAKIGQRLVDNCVSASQKT